MQTAPYPPAPAPASPATPVTPAEPEAWRLYVLARLSEIGLAAAEDIQASLHGLASAPQALPPDPDKALAVARASAGLGRTFVAASRAVRLAIALHERLSRGEPASSANGSRAPAHTRHAVKAAGAGAGAPVSQAPGHAAPTAIPRFTPVEAPDQPDWEPLEEEDEALDDHWLDEGREALSDLQIDRICADLGLDPDWPARARKVAAQMRAAEVLAAEQARGSQPPAAD